MVFQSRKFKVRVFGLRIPFTIGARAQMELCDQLVLLGIPEQLAGLAVVKVGDWLDRIL